MTPTELRDQTFETIQASLVERRRAAFDVWLQHGPGTNIHVADKAGWPVRSLQPRTSELYEVGLIALAGRQGRHGIYRVRTVAEWEAWKEEQLAAVAEQVTP